MVFKEGLQVVEQVRLDGRARLRKKIGSYRDDGQEYNAFLSSTTNLLSYFYLAFSHEVRLQGK